MDYIYIQVRSNLFMKYGLLFAGNSVWSQFTSGARYNEMITKIKKSYIQIATRNTP